MILAPQTISDKPAAVIVDMDGTLSDATHRLKWIQQTPKDWDRFFDGCSDDPIHTHIGVLVNLLQPTYRVLIVSGRPARCMPATRQWLSRNYISYAAIYSRSDSDRRPDDVIKEEILDRDILPQWTPAFAIDDRDRVVSMWRRRGIPCLQVAPGDF